MNQFCPLVSIVIPVYNGSDYLKEAIDSALNQTYKNIEIIVVNDGSTDGGKTREIASLFGDKIRYFEKENGGVATALNFGIDKMNGEYFSWLSHDDVYYKNKIQVQIGFLSELDDKTAILYSDYDLIDENSRYIQTENLVDIDPSQFRLWITTESSLHGCTLLICRKCFYKCGTFNTSLLTTQDYDLWFRIAEYFRFLKVPKVLLASRQHMNQTTRKIVKKVIVECNLLRIGFMSSLYTNKDQDNMHAELYSMGIKLYKHKFYLASYLVFKNAVNHSSLKSKNEMIKLYYYKYKSLIKIVKNQSFLLKYIGRNQLIND